VSGYWLVTRDRPGLVAAVLPLLADDARLVLEGSLGRCRFAAELSPSRVRDDLVVLPLSPDSVRPILDVITPGPLDRDIVRVRIEAGSRILFQSDLDDPTRSAFLAAHAVNEDFLFRLQVLGIIRTWMGATEGP
jgi:hypothetical protein